MKIKIDNHFYIFPEKSVITDNYDGENLRYYKPYIIYETYPCQEIIALLWSRNDNDAIEDAIDENKLDQYKIDDTQNYSLEELDEFYCGGNAGEFFDLSFVKIKQLPAFTIDYFSGIVSGLKEKGIEFE